MTFGVPVENITIYKEYFDKDFNFDKIRQSIWKKVFDIAKKLDTEKFEILRKSYEELICEIHFSAIIPRRFEELNQISENI